MIPITVSSNFEIDDTLIAAVFMLLSLTIVDSFQEVSVCSVLMVK